MSISESERRVIYDNLESTIGFEAANYLMKMIPYPPAGELATRTDMHAETAMLRGELGELRGELKTDMSELRVELKTEMSELRVELKTEMSELRVELTAAFGELRNDFGELRSEFSSLRSETKSDLLTLESRLDTRFQRRFSEARALTIRLFAVSLSANAVAVVTALAV